jgi:hypothetical protein
VAAAVHSQENRPDRHDGGMSISKHRLVLKAHVTIYIRCQELQRTQRKTRVLSLAQSKRAPSYTDLLPTVFGSMNWNRRTPAQF